TRTRRPGGPAWRSPGSSSLSWRSSGPSRRSAAPTTRRLSTPHRPPRTRSTRSQTPAATPLELLALDHQQHGQVLTVTGRVRNPRGATAMPSPTATVFLFGADGSVLTSGGALLDVPTLTAGAEAGFAVSIPVNGTVAR